MRKLSVFLLGTTLSILFIFGEVRPVKAYASEETTVYVGGMSAGFTLKTGGAQIIGLSEVVAESGIYSPASHAGLRAGDIIQKVNGIDIEKISELNEIVEKSKGKELEVEVLRGEDIVRFRISAIKEKITNRFKIGVLVRESISGIGTVTYIEKNGRFASLGHAVVGDNQRRMQISDGAVYACSIVGISKGTRGKAGELRGMFLNDKHLGKAEKLCNCGIFGQISEDFSVNQLVSTVASSKEVKPGNACIYTTICGIEPKRYEVEIVKVDRYHKENKNYVIKITDERLLSETGGIVQGMSGSPILQEGKIVGAITHVFLNDPTRGYGIDVDRMLCE